MNVLFFTCLLDNYAPTAASLRFRAQWPAKYWPEADVYPTTRRPLGEYDLYIFQKAYLTDFPRQLIHGLASKGKVLAFDLCDADWAQSEEHERRLLAVLPYFDFAVSPTAPIRDYLARWVPAYVIPDRLDLDEFTADAERVPADPPRLIWYGYAHNIEAIEPLRPAIREHGLSLTILSNALPESWKRRSEVTFVEWTREGANAVIAQHDIALCPPASPYKSDNRLSTAWALGVNTATSEAELLARLAGETLPPADLIAYAHKNYDVHLSVEQWRELAGLYLPCDPNGNGEERT